MSSNEPVVSVVIPAYNQARYLAEAIRSVLAQTYPSYELIVVDDGSTDDTASIALSFRPVLRYIRQENQGLAGARNTGIQQARGQYVALLDSDDSWLPSFLAAMISLVQARPDAVVYYCGVIYTDEQGGVVPQSGRVRILDSPDLYRTLLRFNFLIPSTILMRRSVVMNAGLFDVAFRRLQDWELWIRLLRHGHQFAGLDECLIRYRLHQTSLSTDASGGEQAARALVEKNFGPDDGNWDTWGWEKRRAYGGLYRYCAVTTSLLRLGDWDSCARHLRLAFQMDPSLASDLDLFYELALGPQVPGYRGVLSNGANLEANALQIDTMLKHVFAQPVSAKMAHIRRRAYGTAYYALGSLAYNHDAASVSRPFLRKAVSLRPDLLRDVNVLSLLMKATVGRSRISRLRRVRDVFHPRRSSAG